MTKTPRNLLLIITDQHRPDHCGFGGNDVVQTPNLDALAARGAVYDRAFVANPICMPNRSTIFTGRMPSAHGTRFNGIALDWYAQTFPRMLMRQGYDTAYFGKCHLQNMGSTFIPPRRQEGPFDSDPVGSASEPPLPEGWDALEHWRRWIHEDVQMPEDFYGFRHVDLVVNHADYATGHYYRWLLREGIDPEAIQGRDNAAELSQLCEQVWRTSVPAEYYPTRYIGNQTSDFLRGRDGDKPFMAVCSFPDPHHPFTPPGEYYDLFDPDRMPLPESFYDGHQASMPHYRNAVGRRGQQPNRLAFFSPSEEQLREMMAREFGAIRMIDDEVGRILDALREQGLEDDTLVVFTADHGDMFGDHGMMLKGLMHYEGCVRVPMVMAGPGVKAGRRQGLVGSIDIGPTVLDALGHPHWWQGVQGRSFAASLADPAADTGRDQVLIEEEQVGTYGAKGPKINIRTLITQEGRLTRYQGLPMGECFDRDKDPGEMHNLFADPAGADLRHHLQERLTDAMMRHATTERVNEFTA